MPSFWDGGEAKSFYIQHSENVINNPVHPVPEKLALPVPESLALVISYPGTGLRLFFPTFRKKMLPGKLITRIKF